MRNNDVRISYEYFELDELYWFIEKKLCTETRENVYIMTMVSREPRQIVGFDVSFDKLPKRIQNIITQMDIMDTFTVEGVNTDLRHYIPVLARRSRCFSRSLETLKAVVAVFVDAYNQFGLAKFKY